MIVSAKRRKTKDGMKTVSMWIGLLAAGLVLTASTPRAPKGDLILYGGDVVTLDEAGTVAEAVWVRDGRIAAVGTREEIMRHATKTTELVDLQGAALLPGFVEPHLHLDFLTFMSFYIDLSPCLPAPYETRARCPVTLEESLRKLGDQAHTGTGWLIGGGIDPSRNPSPSVAVQFHQEPARFIEQFVSKTRPVIILDASGHLAYANRQAFVTAGICATVDNCSEKTAMKSEPVPPGQWVTDSKGSFTGLLVEQQAYVDFVAAIPQLKWNDFVDRAEGIAREFARAGVTTMVNGGTENGPVADLLQILAWQAGDHPWLRYRTLLPVVPVSSGAQDFGKPSPWDESDGGLFGVTGVKLWADGSAQGCTAALVDPYDKDGSCFMAGTGMADYCTQQIQTLLAPLWKAGWPIQIHVNGDQAILNALNALAALQIQTLNPSPITLLHFTVDGNPATGEDMVQRVADLRAGRFVSGGKTAPPVDVRVSHLIGHVAYWGGAFQGILDGVRGPGHPDEKGRAARLVATRRELELGVPFSLHSDAPISPVHPLWYVEQAVTRNTWFYPRLGEKESHPMPGGQNITIEQALRAVTIEPAIQHGLAHHLGSIEAGKVADLVILDKNPLRQPANEIRRLRVLSTFVGGFRNDWSKE
jgi:predicted amidohydrolase YtcJ